jgi:hypothetical protein
MPGQLPPNNRKRSIKVFKLISNEDIIGYQFNEDEKRLLNVMDRTIELIVAPRQLTTESTVDGIFMIMKDWAPYSKDRFIVINKDKIIATFNPTDEYLNHYLTNCYDAEYYISDYYHKKLFMDLYKFDQNDNFQ